jgi:hypothetical protein
MRRENTMEQHDSTEAPLCDACRRIPISHLSLDVSEPLVGWSAFFEERYITVMDDSLGRPSVARHVVADLLVSEHDWSWVMLELAEEGLPVTKVPRSPQRLALQWQQFSDAITEKRLTHGPDPVLARHAANLGLISGPSGLRPDLDVGEGQSIASALAAMISFDGVTRLEHAPPPRIHVYKKPAV